MNYSKRAPWQLTRLSLLALTLSFLIAGLIIPAFASTRGDPLAKEIEACLECHGQPGLSVTLPNGEEMPLYVDRKAFASSIHGDKLRCSDCHSDILGYPHPERKFKNRRDYTLILYESCKQCHFANYTKSLDSVHYFLLSRGDLRAPVCVDCHTAHEVTRPDRPRARISRTCARCHPDISDTYLKSVHGKALIEEDNQDVPVCTDCHRSHNIEDPRTPTFLLKTPELCGGCHKNEALMKKYGISTQVFSSYIRDFHGVTTKFYRKRVQDITSYTAVCTDCHGVHDISKAHAPASPVMKANLVKTCRKCHPEASENFPDAWLSHYEPSVEKAALVYYVKLFYTIFIPFVVGGLLLQILLHVWRVAVGR